MLRAVVIGFLLGPIALLVVMLVWSKAGLAMIIAGGVLFGAFIVAVLAGAAAGGALRPRRLSAPPVAADEDVP